MSRRVVVARIQGRGQKKITIELVCFEGVPGLSFAFLTLDASGVQIGQGTPPVYDLPVGDEAATAWLDQRIEANAIRGFWGEDSDGTAALVLPRPRLLVCQPGVPALLEYELVEPQGAPLVPGEWSFPAWVTPTAPASTTEDGRVRREIVVDAPPGTAGWISLRTPFGAVATGVSVIVGRG